MYLYQWHSRYLQDYWVKLTEILAAAFHRESRQFRSSHNVRHVCRERIPLSYKRTLLQKATNIPLSILAHWFKKLIHGCNRWAIIFFFFPNCLSFPISVRFFLALWHANHCKFDKAAALLAILGGFIQSSATSITAGHCRSYRNMSSS